MGVSDIITAGVAFLIAIMFLVFIHEYGHYKVGRLLGVNARKFSIGFGKPIKSWTDKNGCQWQIAPIPLGGYVAFVDGRNETLSEQEKLVAFDHKPRWKRSLIVLAGPLTNLVFAILAFWALNLMGTQDVRPMMGPIQANSLAQQGGFESHMQIMSINGEKMHTMTGVNLALAKAAIEKKKLNIEAQRVDGTTALVNLNFEGFDVGKHSRVLMEAMGFVMPGVVDKPRIGSVMPGSVAQKAGIKENSIVISIEGEPLQFWSDLRYLMMKHYQEGKAVNVVLEDAKGVRYEVQVAPKADESGIPKMGVGLAPDNSKEHQERWYVTQQPGVLEALQLATVRSYDVSVMSLKAIGGMVMGTDSLKGISGPVGIAEQAGKALDVGIKAFIGFVGFISLSLFLMNMLPIPALDGGHLVQYAIEGALRRPLSDQAQIWLGKVGFSMLIALMFLAIFNDITRVFGIG